MFNGRIIINYLIFNTCNPIFKTDIKDCKMNVTLQDFRSTIKKRSKQLTRNQLERQ